MSKILGFDISSISTGYCVFINGKLIKSSCGIINSNIGSYGQRLQFFSEQIRNLIHKYNPDYIAIENIFKGRNILTFKSLAMFRGVAILTIYESCGLNPIDIMATKARGIVKTGKSKEEAFNFIVKKYGLNDFNFKRDNDKTDAIVLALAAHIAIRDNIDLKFKKKRRKRKKKK